MKAHLPHYMLGYFQERMDIDVSVTLHLGWVQGETYYDTYAPALPKEAILGAHRYKTHKTYSPAWRHIQAPKAFLQLVCPMTEGIHATIVGRKNLSGASNYWSIVIDLLPHLFQCGAAIFQLVLKSALFRLPALANPDVQNWMKYKFPGHFSAIKASMGDSVDFQRIQNSKLCCALENVQSLLVAQKLQFEVLVQSQNVLLQRT
ncbi:hypothetical protein CVT24_005890 [Panaeolus cyanescens]|uniref:Ndc10 domain-containing protein n=1 Tax=Panaeolus cyanescens TaxID=181874 RepID=A0A409WZR2_9AGAR|nr:hypothetical protein CVT24_005890 [Panaeolus cyanescens]